jgi:hypothetical protein
MVIACGGGVSNTSAPSQTGSTASASPSNGGNGGGSAAGGTGQLTIGITDSPFSDAKALLVTFDGVSVHQSGTGWATVPFKDGALQRTCDLKKLAGPTDILGVAQLAAGHYTQIRLNVKEASLVFDAPSPAGPACAPTIAPAGTDIEPVEIPSGEVKLNREFTLAAGNTMMILLDFDGDKSIHETGAGNAKNKGNGNAGNAQPTRGRFMMNPVVGVVSVR